jgi:purine-cytosine permease-like protein
MMVMANSKTIQNEVFFSLLPAKKKDRALGMFDLMAVQVCFGIAAWFFLTGSQTGMLLPAREAIPTILMGNCLPIFLIAFIGIASSRYGVEQMTVSAGIFGQKGSVLMLIFYLLACYPALAMATLMFGQSATKFTAVLNGPAFLSVESPGVTIFAVIALIGGVYIAILGPNALRWCTRLSAIFMIIIIIVLIVYLFRYHGISAVLNAEPAEPYVFDGDPRLGKLWSRASAIEANVGLGLSWGFFFGQWTRLAKSEGAGYHGCMWGWGVLAAVAGVFAAFAALAIGEYDPTAWIVRVSHSTGLESFAVVGLVLMAVANISSVATLVYPAAISIRSRFPKVNWVAANAIAAAPTFLLMFPVVYYMISNVYAFIGLLTGIYSAIVVADYLFVSRGRFRMREFFSTRNGYQYAKGWNPGALVAIAAGFVTYLSLLNPLTWTSPSGLFPYLTAGFPTFIITAIVYTLCMKLWVLKKYKIPYVNDFETEK